MWFLSLRILLRNLGATEVMHDLLELPRREPDVVRVGDGDFIEFLADAHRPFEDVEPIARESLLAGDEDDAV